MFALQGRGRNVPFISGRFFLGCWTRGNSSLASVVADRDVIYDHSFVVDIRDVCNIVYGAVIEECSILPISALISNANISEAVVYPSIEPDLSAPVALMK